MLDYGNECGEKITNYKNYRNQFFDKKLNKIKNVITQINQSSLKEKDKIALKKLLIIKISESL